MTGSLMTGSVTVRRIGSVPARTSSQTWRAIVDTIAAPDSAAHGTLLQAAGVASMLIAEAYTRDTPIVVTPLVGSRVRIYTVHGVDADETVTDETPLATWPTAGWSVSLPCSEPDLAFASTRLAHLQEITVRDSALGLLVGDADADPSPASASMSPWLRIDTSWLEN